MEPLERGVANSFLRVASSWKQFLNREPLEPPLSKYGTVGTGVAFLNVPKYGCKRFLNMEQLERGVAIQFLNREPLEPPVSNMELLERGLQTVSK